MEEKLNQLTFPNAALFGLLIAVGYYVLFYHPSNPQNQLDEMGRELVTIKGEISKLDREIKKGLRINQEIEVLQKKADKVYAQLPEGLSVEQASGIVSQEARNVGLSIQSISAEGTGWAKLQTVAVVPINTVVSGTFEQMMIFLSELTRNNKVYSVRSLSISGNDEDQPGILVMTVKVQAYRKLAVSEIKSIGDEGGDGNAM